MIGRIGTAFAVAAVAALVVVGCTPEDPVETASVSATEPAASGVPDEQEILDDAFATAREFYRLVDEGFATGELSDAALQRVATAEAIAKVQSELDEFTGLGWTLNGTSSLDSPALTRWDDWSDASGTIEVLACLDTSNVVTMNAAGEPVTGGEPRQPRLFTVKHDESGMRVADLTPVDPNTELAGCG
ncbi:hypothetical protein [Agrococcus sp. ProA11]|uniref:hypothetical protein n=1 Tax=Agrococcus chionoecetis TaxID=3153752 RepID=UPI0032613393